MEVICASPWVPVEWIQAHGHEPRAVWLAPPVAVAAVPEGICAFAQSVRHLTDARPEAAVVFTTACDQLRRAADAALPGQGERVFLFNLPVTWQTSAARQLYHAEVARFGRFLTRLGGRAPSDAALRTAIREADERRDRARATLDRGSARQVMEALGQTLSGEAISISRPAPASMDRGCARQSADGSERTESAALSRAQPRGSREALPASPDSGVRSAKGIPLALVGGPFTTAEWPLLDCLEAAGGQVVLHAAEPGERTLLPALGAAAESDDPIRVLADHYFDHLVDVFQRPNVRLYDWLRLRLAERRVRGLVLWAHIGCDLWRAEAASLREAFGLPLLLLEAHATRGVAPRDLNRLQAFLESLR